MIRHGEKAVKTIHVATMNDIFQQENTFLVRVSESQKKISMKQENEAEKKEVRIVPRK
ncbi:MAG: hypothetical protein ACTSVY_03755 [Candidatus Helarchaeota archaeon]